MAKRSSGRSTALVRYINPRPVVPTIRVAMPRSPGKLARAARRGARHVSTEASQNKHRLGAIGAGFVLGYMQKNNWSIPAIPMLGQAGTLAVASYYGGKFMKSRMLSHMATGFAAIAAYELGKDGSIAGYDM